MAAKQSGDKKLVAEFAALVRSFTPQERRDLRDVLKDMLSSMPQLDYPPSQQKE